MKKQIHFICNLMVALCLLLTTVVGYAQVEDEKFTPRSGQSGKDVVWVPTPQMLVDTMLSMANVTSADYLIDLGSGDGRLVITAAKLGANALGIEYNQDMVELARRTAKEEGVSERATFRNADLFESDFSEADVLTLFLLASINMRLRPKIFDMKPGTRVVSNSFDMEDWKPDQTKHIAHSDISWNTAHLWIVPAKVEGIWKFDNGQINIVQDFQYISGTVTIGKENSNFTGKLDGNKISINVENTEYIGTVSNNTISVTRPGGGSWKAHR